MAYRLYISIIDLPPNEFARQKPMLTPNIFEQLDDVLGGAHAALASGLFIHLVEGDDGTVFAPERIHQLLRERAHDLKDRAKLQ